MRVSARLEVSGGMLGPRLLGPGRLVRMLVPVLSHWGLLGMRELVGERGILLTDCARSRDFLCMMLANDERRRGSIIGEVRARLWDMRSSDVDWGK